MRHFVIPHTPLEFHVLFEWPRTSGRRGTLTLFFLKQILLLQTSGLKLKRTQGPHEIQNKISRAAWQSENK